MAELFVLVLVVYMSFWFVCAVRATIRQSQKEQITTFSDINKEMVATLRRWLRPKN